jgi:TRAP transporter TAXI family solute receptor
LAASATLSVLPKHLEAQQPSFLRIGTASTAGIYFPIGSLIASAISNPPGSRECERGGSCGVPGLVAVVQTTSGSVENVAALSSGMLETGFCQADVAYWAFHGQGPYEGEPPAEKLRAIANLYPEVIQLVVRAGSNIRTVADLRGRRISIDANGSGTQVDAKLILEAWGLSSDDFDAHSVPANIAAGLLRSGELDGFFMVAGIPTPSIQNLAGETPINLVPIDGEEAEDLQERFPFFVKTRIPPGTYPGTFPTSSLSIGAQWLTTSDLDEDLVYGLAKALWHPSNRALLDKGHPKGRLIRLETALDGLGVPLHPGARRFYEEMGHFATQPVPTDTPETGDPAVDSP